jgi:murein DD-endopeptidase MepM/ murein hydrolase activator NlpD
LITIQILTGGRPPDISEAELDAQLVPVEPAEAPVEAEGESPDDIAKYLPPKIIDLSGDPLVIKHGAAVSRQLRKLGPEIASAAKKVGLGGDIYRLTDGLRASGASLLENLNGSQQDFAFFTASDSGESTNGDSADDQESAPLPEASESASVIEVNGGGGASTIAPREVFTQSDRNMQVSEALIAYGFDKARARSVEKSFSENFRLASLTKDDQIAVRGFSTDEEKSALVPAQVSAYRKGIHLGTVALTELDTYAAGEDPWFGQNIFAAPDDASSGASKLRLLDAIYDTAVRNGLPTSVAGETILLLSRANDLEQAADDGDRMTLLYSTVARDRKTGFGRVLYVLIERSSSNIECYAFQSKAGQQYDCVSNAGLAADAGGMITPVKGVMAAKFGPVVDPATGKKKMNFGVNWSAPLGTPVVAAFAGQVAAAGRAGKLGNYIKLTHTDGMSTGYAYLQRFARDATIGNKVRAGQVIGYVGQSGEAREPMLHFEMYQGTEPVDPFGQFRRAVEKGGTIDFFVNRIIYVESANNCNARNPLSTAVGLGQFIESTWLNTVRQHRPDLFEGRTRAQILDLRTECNLAREMTAAFTRDNAAVLRSQGHPVTPGNLYLAHFMGVGGALQVLSGNPDALIVSVFGESHVRANPFEAGKSLGWLVRWAAGKMNQKTPVTLPAGGPSSINKYANNKAFLALKDAVAAMLR